MVNKTAVGNERSHGDERLKDERKTVLIQKPKIMYSNVDGVLSNQLESTGYIAANKQIQGIYDICPPHMRLNLKLNMHEYAWIILVVEPSLIDSAMCHGVLPCTCRNKYMFQTHCTIFIGVAINKPPAKQYTHKQTKLETRCRLEMILD